MTDDAKGERERLSKLMADLLAKACGGSDRASDQLTSLLADHVDEIIDALAPAQAQHCPTCGTHEVSLHRTCHNSACAAYAEAVTVYEGWHAQAQRVEPELGRCCYGGMRTREACASCAAWRPSTESAASAAPWSGLPPVVSDEIADISLACTPASAAPTSAAPCPIHPMRTQPCEVCGDFSRAPAASAEPVAWPTDKQIKEAFDIVSKDKRVDTHLALVVACFDLLRPSNSTMPPASAEDAPCSVSVEACEECMNIIGRLTAANAAARAAMGADK